MYVKKDWKEQSKVFSHVIEGKMGKNTVVKLQQGMLCQTVRYWKGVTTMQHLGQWSKLPWEGVESVSHGETREVSIIDDLG